MNRLLLRTLNPLLFLGISLLGLAIQSSLFRWSILSWAQPDLMIILVIWLALKRDFGEGGVLTLLLASIAEIHSAAPRGILLLHAMVVFLGVCSLTKYFVVGKVRQWIILTALCSILWSISNETVLFLLRGTFTPLGYALTALFQKMIATSVFSYWAYPLLDRFDILTHKKREGVNRLEDDIQIFEEETI